ncbi:MAG: hypothetical protein IT454_22945 [Planctomycetes bacterium]|nr:hypothetical protein [Planctomycetota bacterium]
MTVEVNELAQRVSRLETENRRLKRIGLGLAALAGAVTLCSAAMVVCDTVYGERFVIRDTGGRERAVITAYETRGLPQLQLMNQKGQKALTLGVAEDGRAYLEVADNAGKPVRSFFAVGAEGNATIEKPAPQPEKKKDGEVALATR